MTKRTAFTVSLIIFFLFLSLLSSVTRISLGVSTTAVSIFPSTSSVSAGQSFTVDVRISDVVNLYGWEFKLEWNSSLLQVIDVTEGPFLKQQGLTFFTYINNNTAGYVLVDCSLLSAVPDVSGNGTLASVQFYAATAGSGTLDLISTVLLNSQEQAIPHAEVDGSVVVLPLNHDVAITNVVLSKTVVGQGLTMRIWVTTRNNGGYTETFYVSVYYNSTNLIAKQSVTLAARTFTIITFRWNTTGMAKRHYVISAVADSVPGETDLTNNFYIGGTVTVALIGDITSTIAGTPDGKVDIRDLALMAKAYGSAPTSPNWNPNADITEDDKVDIRDLATAAKHYGQTDP